MVLKILLVREKMLDCCQSQRSCELVRRLLQVRKRRWRVTFGHEFVQPVQIFSVCSLAVCHQLWIRRAEAFNGDRKIVWQRNAFRFRDLHIQNLKRA